MKTILLLLVLTALTVVGLHAQEQLNGRILLNISGTDIKEPMDVTYYLLNGEVLMKPQVLSNQRGKAEDMAILFKPQQKVFFILISSKDGKLAMRNSYESIVQQLDTNDIERPTLTPTSETKTINGYVCHKVTAETSKTKTDMWLTNDLNFHLGKLMAYSSMGKGRNQGAGRNWGDVNGASLETVVTDLDRGTVSTILVKEISLERPSPALFDMSEYQVMEMPQVPLFNSMNPFKKRR
jgi:hypothetical protein